MMKMTLLEIVQNILSAMDSDEVTSISDTVESIQVAEVVKETYFEQFSNQNIHEFRKLLTITDAGTITSPNYLQLQDELVSLDWLRYKDPRNNNKYKPVEYVSNEEFFEMVLKNTSSLPNMVPTEDLDSGVTYYIPNNIAPSYYTVLAGSYIATDSYDATYEDTLHEANTVGFGQVAPAWSMTNTFIPELDAKKFPQLLAEAKSVCFINFKQVSSTKEEQRARRQRVKGNNDRYRAKQGNEKFNDKFNFARRR